MNIHKILLNRKRLFWITVIFLNGCSSSATPELCYVSGTVTFSGKPISNCQISFMSSDGFGASAIIRDDGRYFLQSQYGNGIPGGTYKVVIQPPSVYEGPVGDTPVGGDLESDIKILPFPVKYQEFSTSDLQFIAQPGSKEFDVTLEN